MHRAVVFLALASIASGCALRDIPLNLPTRGLAQTVRWTAIRSSADAMRRRIPSRWSRGETRDDPTRRDPVEREPSEKREASP